MTDLKPTLGLTDHMLFGVSSILGSGGFNLVGKAVRAGGGAWPALLALVTALFGGASWSYTRALQVEGSNTSETDVIERVFGRGIAGVAGVGILVFNIFSIAVILVFVAQLMFPAAAWLTQVGVATIFLAIMTAASLWGIDVNKEIINWTTWALLVVLTAGLGLGGWGALTRGLPGGVLPTGHSAVKSLMHFFFIMAGFDALMKFVRESVDAQRDLPIAFFGSNGLSALLVLGVAAALAVWVPGLTAAQEDNAMGHLFANFLGPGAVGGMRVAMILFMLITTFVVFLATTRYLFGIGEKEEGLRFLTEVNDAQTPWRSVAVVTLVSFVGLLLNNTDVLVRISNAGLVVIMGLVSAAVAAYDGGKGSVGSATVSAATAAGLGGILGVTFL